MSPSAMPEDTPDIPNTTVLTLRKTVTDESAPLALRFRALFSLKHLASSPPASSDDAATTTLAAIDAIAAAFASPSALLKHELAYCLGQTRNVAALPCLRRVLEDLEEDPMCRHEAAEAMGAIGQESCLDVLRRFRDRVGEETVVTETCQIAVDRIEWELSQERRRENVRQRYVGCVREWHGILLSLPSDFASIDPAPPLDQSACPSIDDLQHTLLDTSIPLFKRYRAMFALRDLASPPDLPTAIPAVLALATGLQDPSALFRHEIAFVFGQLSHPASIPALTASLSDLQEASMVRHEAAEALGSLGEVPGVEDTLRCFLNDKEQVVRESVVVALDMAEFEKTGQTEYALIPEAIPA